MAEQTLSQPNTGAPMGPKKDFRSPSPFKGRGGSRPGGDRGGSRYSDRPKPEFDQKILAIRRVTRVVAGGRRMAFSVAMAIGDKKGMIGVGTGKGLDTALAINKAIKSAKKNMVKLKLTKTMSLPHQVSAKYSSSSIMIMPNRGRGLVAGSAIRDIINLGGIKDTTAKVLSGSKNKLNIARATVKALSAFKAKTEKISIPDAGKTEGVQE
jgi:small subunit ribosomal protein S5